MSMDSQDPGSERPRRKRRTVRKTWRRPTPKPEVVLSETPDGGTVADEPIDISKLEPSKPRPREDYEPTEEDSDAFVKVVEDILDCTDLDWEVEFEHGDYQRAWIDVDKERAGALIGKRGAGIEALELLVGRMTSQAVGHAVPVQVDVNEYRKKIEDDLRELARDAVERCDRDGEPVHLPPMNARDRRVVHVTIQEMEGAPETYTVGEGSRRHIIVHRP